MTDIQQVTDTMTYEVKNSFTSSKRWSGDYHVMRIIKQTEKAVYCLIENQNRFGFETWIPKSCLIQVEREALKSCVREIGDATCEWIIEVKKRTGYTDWESAKRYIKKCAQKGVKYVNEIDLNRRYIHLTDYPIPYYDVDISWMNPKTPEKAEKWRLERARSPCSVTRKEEYFE